MRRIHYHEAECESPQPSGHRTRRFVPMQIEHYHTNQDGNYSHHHYHDNVHTYNQQQYYKLCIYSGTSHSVDTISSNVDWVESDVTLIYSARECA